MMYFTLSLAAQDKTAVPSGRIGSVKPEAQAGKSVSGEGAKEQKPAAVPDVSKEALVFDKLYTHIREEADGTGIRETIGQVRILADAGVKEMAVLAFNYTASNQQVDIDYVRVRKPDGSVVVTPAYNVQEMPASVTREAPMYSDIHEKHVAVKGLSVGDSLEYKITLRTLKPEVPGQFWFEYSFNKNLIVLDEQLDLDVPADKAVTVASEDQQPLITVNDGHKVYRWRSSNLARPDPDAPPKSYKHWKPSVQATTFTSWEQIGAWYAALQKNSLEVTPDIQRKANALTEGLTTQEEKMRAIFNAVALHIHYVGLSFGIGRYQPHPADDVLSNQYGDCKDKHTLLASLLHAAGIDAWAVLISSNRELDPALPSPAQFDHVITVVPEGDKLLWMDSTAEVAPIGVLFGPLRDKQALVVPVGKSAYLARTPVEVPYSQSVIFNVDGKLSDHGVLTGRIAQTYHGDMEMIMRIAFRQVSQSQWKEFLQNLSNAAGFAGEVTNPQVSNVEQIGQPMSFSYDYKREKFGEWDSHRISAPFPSVGWELGPGVKEKKPADDVDIGSPGDMRYQSDVELPKGWILFPMANVEVKEDWAEYQSKYSFENGVFRAQRTLIVKKSKVPLAEWEKYLSFRRAIYNDEVQMAALVDPTGSVEGTNSTVQYRGGYSMSVGGGGLEIAVQQKALQEVALVLSSDAPAGTQELLKASDTCRKALEAVEAKTLTQDVTDPEALRWTPTLALVWSMTGWVALEMHDLPKAENYLRAAWHLGQDRVTAYQLGRTLQAKGDKAGATHFYELAAKAKPGDALGGLFLDKYKVEGRIAESYQKLTGADMTTAIRNKYGQYADSLRVEMDKDWSIHQMIHTSTLTGSALYLVALEPGKPTKATLLRGESGFRILAATVQARIFPALRPTGSKARVFREVRLVCTPYAGCDGYVLQPFAMEIPMQDKTVTVMMGGPIN